MGAINNTKFGGFMSRAEEIGNLAKTIYELTEEIPLLYLRMRFFGQGYIEVFACDTSTDKQFEMDNFQIFGTSFIDFYHFVALVIDAKRGVSK